MPRRRSIPGKSVDAEPLARQFGPTDVAAREAGHNYCEEELEGDRAQAKPERAIGRGKRHHSREPSEVREWIDHRREDVKGEEHEGHQCKVAVQAGGEKARPAGGLNSKR